VLKRTVITAAALLVSGFALAGCAPAESTPVASSSQSGSVSTDSAEVTDDASSSLLDAVETSYQRWLEVGMTEEVTSAGDDYILSYEPGESFIAGLYNVGLDDIIPIEQPELFTVYSAWMMLQDAATVIEENDNRLTLRNDNYGNFTMVIEEGLIISAEEVEGAWSGVFRYEPDAEVLSRLAASIAAGN